MITCNPRDCMILGPYRGTHVSNSPRFGVSVLGQRQRRCYLERHNLWKLSTVIYRQLFLGGGRGPWGEYLRFPLKDNQFEGPHDGSRQFIATSAEVTPKGSLVRESYTQNGLISTVIYRRFLLRPIWILDPPMEG